MGYNRAVKTEAGIELLSRVTAGETTITFTKIATSENAIDNFEIKQQVNPSASKFTRDNKVGVILDAVFGNTDVTIGYDINVIGIYAKDSNNVEILFSYLTSDGNPTHINPYNGETPENVNIQVESGIWLDSGTMITIDPSGVATQQYVKDNMPPTHQFIITMPTETTSYETITDTASKTYYKYTYTNEEVVDKFCLRDLYLDGLTLLDDIENAENEWGNVIKVVCNDGSIDIYIKEIPTNSFKIKVAQ